MDLALLTFLVAVDGWTPHTVVDGITVESRAVPNSAYEAVRVRAQSAAPPAVQAEVIWGPAGIEGVANRREVKQHEVLFDAPNERLFYQRVAAPRVSDRDFVVRRWRRRDGDVHEIRWNAASDARWPTQPGVVRVERLFGSCVVEPSDDGGSIVTYETFTDLAGSLPAWVTRGPMRRAAVEWVETMRARAAAHRTTP